MNDAFGRLTSAADPAMIIVTTVADGERAGCLVGFHAQAGLDTEHYCVWLSKANHTYRVVLEAEHIAVHFLTVEDEELAARFGTRSGEDTDKFAGLDITAGPSGVPLLDALPNRLVGRRAALLDVGADHVCVTLAVEAATCPGPFQPLRTSQEVHLRPGHEADERAVPPGRVRS